MRSGGKWSAPSVALDWRIRPCEQVKCGSGQATAVGRSCRSERLVVGRHKTDKSHSNLSTECRRLPRPVIQGSLRRWAALPLELDVRHPSNESRPTSRSIGRPTAACENLELTLPTRCSPRKHFDCWTSVGGDQGRKGSLWRLCAKRQGDCVRHGSRHIKAHARTKPHTGRTSAVRERAVVEDRQPKLSSMKFNAGVPSPPHMPTRAASTSFRGTVCRAATALPLPRCEAMSLGKYVNKDRIKSPGTICIATRAND